MIFSALKKNIFLRVKAGIDKVDIEHLPEDFLDENIPPTARVYNNAWKKRNDFWGIIGAGKHLEIDHFIFYGGFECAPVYYVFLQQSS